MNRTFDAAHPAAHPADSLAALRAATASRHAALDSGLPIGAPDASLDDYTAHLALLRAWLAPLTRGWPASRTARHSITARGSA